MRTIKTYTIVARPDLRLAAHGMSEPTLTMQGLLGQLGSAAIHQLSHVPWGQEAEIEVRAANDADALNRIEVTLAQLGFALVEATVRAWTTEALERAALGVGVGVAAGGVFENVLIGLACSTIGGMVGAWSGAQAHKLVAEFEASRDHRGAWRFRELPQPASKDAALETGLSPA